MVERKDLVRFGVFAAFIAVLVVLVLWKYVSVMVIAPVTDPLQASGPVVERGPILDRNGKLLAVETRQDSVTAWIPDVVDKADDARLLSGVLAIPKQELLSTLSSHTGFVFIKRQISQSESKQIQALKEAGKLAGIELRPDYGRIYTEGDLAGHVIGYVGTDNTGLDGIELTFNNQLSPPPPKSTAAGGDFFGNQVFLTIDQNIQYFAQSLASKVFQDSEADSVILIVMGAKSGDILAYVSCPEFDPNTFSKFPAAVRQDRANSYIYEPGSVMKIFTISSFLELGGITPETEFYDDGTYEHALPDGDVIRIKGLAPHEWEDAQLIIKFSSNVGAAYASDTVSDSALYQMLKAFGFGSPTFVPLPGEASGILRPISEWTPRSKPTISFGQEIGVTAIQVAAAATALTNDGILLKPHIVEKVVGPDGRLIQSFPREPIRRVISSEIAHEMLGFMETGTDPDGFAHDAKVPGMPTSAKTGTAQMLDPQTGRYSETAYTGSCIAIFPTDDPQVIVYAVVINPKKGPYWGSGVASPLIRQVSERLISYLGIPKEGDQVVSASPPRAGARAPLSLSTTLPDLTGLSKRELLPLFADRDLNVRVSGSGWVVSQTPPPGTPLTKGMTVSVVLQ